MEKTKRQLHFAIENAHPKVREYGLQEVHPIPFVGQRDAYGRVYKSFRVPQDKAWEYPDVGYINSANAYAAVVIDIDRPEKLNDIILAGSSFQPNWAVFNHKNGHAHAAYTLQKPVLKYSTASPKPIQYLADIEKKMIQALDGDPGYTAHLARNPITKDCFGTETLWLRHEPWLLDELNDAVMSHLPADWKPSKLSESPEGAFGRNCTLFHSLMEWAGRKCNRYEDVMMQAQLINLEFCTPLSYNEVKSTAKSVSKYQARWEANGWHDPSWLKKQKYRGVLGNQAKAQKNIVRDKEILEDSRNGMKQFQIAAKHGLTKGRISQILKKFNSPTQDGSSL